MAGKKSVIVAYIFWALGGWFGLHHFYLGRDRQAFVWWCLLAGYGGLGWFNDIFSIPAYVREANFSEEYVAELVGEMKKNPKRPPFSLYRFLGQITFGNLLSWVLLNALPIEETIFGFHFTFLNFLVSIASAIGVHTVGNIGREEGGLKWALIGSFIPFIIFRGTPSYYMSSFLSALFFRFTSQWNRKPPQRTKLLKRIVVMSGCVLLYSSLWVSYMYFNVSLTNEYGETIKLRDSVKNLLSSPLWAKFKDSLQQLWIYYWAHGWDHTWSEFVRNLDPMGEKNALAVLELPDTATQEEITKRWRQLSKQFHPDKYSEAQEKLIAQEKFMVIKEAYEKISTLHARRKKNYNF